MRRLVYALAASAAWSLFAPALAAGAEAPRARIDGELDSSLREAIARAVGETDRPIQNRFEARRRAREAGEDAIAVLRSEGYYAYEVEPVVGEGDAPTPVIQVTPGPLFTIAAPKIEWLEPAPGEAAQAAGDKAMALRLGGPGRAAEVVAAEGRIVAAVQKQGYADVRAAPREVIVDHADHTVRPTFRIEAGDLVRLDGIELITHGRTRKRWLDKLATWKPGDAYDPDDVAELERRLLDTGVYDSVTVALAPKQKAQADGRRPIIVSLADRDKRTLELGASYSTSEGAGLDGSWTRYNVLGRADTLAAVIRASDIDSKVGLNLSLPHWRRAQQTLKIGGSAYNDRTSAYDETGVGLSADVTRRFGKTSFLTLGASVDLSRTIEKQTATLSTLGRNLAIFTGLGVLSLDRSNDPLNPTRGWRLETRAEPTLLAGEGALPYLKVQSQATAYLPLTKTARTVLAGRLKLGTTVGGSIPEVPASRRFYAGGGGSVRGYAYQAVGPRLADNTPQGGLSLLEASAEVRQKVADKWAVVAFLDAGAVGTDRFPAGKDLSAGAGLGVRYDLGFAPVRADIAVPLDKRRGDSGFQIYLSIGQSF
ncbi:autotransporter assembly complex family protein [Phenylobacterium sp.]|uniref:autotransporter assembly complex protein TamA n=1 Tax=Phenylobacterium sp. TaxID=1871053 RepID=UPI0035AE64AA